MAALYVLQINRNMYTGEVKHCCNRMFANNPDFFVERVYWGYFQCRCLEQRIEKCDDHSPNSLFDQSGMGREANFDSFLARCYLWHVLLLLIFNS